MIKGVNQNSYRMTIRSHRVGSPTYEFKLEFISQPEGYIEPNATGDFDYIYQYKGHLDNSSVKLHRTVSGGYYAHSNEWIPINESEPTTYKFSGWVYVESSGYSWVMLSFFMNEDTETNYYTEVSEISRIFTKNQWVYLEQEVTVPVNIDKINLRVGLYNGSPSVTAWFDELRIERIGESEIVEESNYYPFGLKHKGYNNIVNGVENNHKTFLGQEINKELGLNWLTFRHRNYMPDIGRFFGIDPISEDFESISTYQVSHNNPVWKVELEGLEGVAFQKLAKYAKKGIKYVAKNSKGQYKPISRKQALKKLQFKKSVTLTGKGQSKNAKKLYKEAHPEAKTFRDNAHKVGRKKGFPHYQKKSGDGSHAFYKTLMLAIGVNATGNAQDDNSKLVADAQSDILEGVLSVGSTIISESIDGHDSGDINDFEASLIVKGFNWLNSLRGSDTDMTTMLEEVQDFLNNRAEEKAEAEFWKRESDRLDKLMKNSPK